MRRGEEVDGYFTVEICGLDFGSSSVYSFGIVVEAMDEVAIIGVQDLDDVVIRLFQEELAHQQKQ